jgi:hypothetical protein
MTRLMLNAVSGGSDNNLNLIHFIVALMVFISRR